LAKEGGSGAKPDRDGGLEILKKKDRNRGDNKRYPLWTES